MSRSYKRFPTVKDHCKGQKQLANKKLRRNKNKYILMQNGEYKKHYEQWEICDWNWYWSKQDAIDSWYEEENPHYEGVAWRHKNYKTLENWLNYWARISYRK